ncbi:L,D-transpeptidase family protein [Streptomyces oryzae]|uniref:L,D-transpeptidase family protein n=1 Tax=Streptomyces oryzae TaxID=1434886 RepID=A0ABS3X7Z6_9ACTN|nr:L,D-transpeptidase family protein [Streptomyces oryzae]MBO8191492.1 L,D-transpeptidase family protein [Streptomyces oryzae]
MPAKNFPLPARSAQLPTLALLLLFGLAEAVPSQALAPRLAGGGSERAAGCSTKAGPQQGAVERYLGLPVDGRQSPKDCEAIRNFQEQEGVLPADGYASPATYRALYVRWAAGHPEKLLADKHCPPARGRVACLDLTHQVLWLLKGRKVVLRAMPARSGAPGYETRTGRFRIQRRVRHDYSAPYRQKMPFSQYFSRGQAFHGTQKNIYSPPGSHGCVNLRYDDAENLWRWMRIGDTVRIWGRKPPT